MTRSCVYAINISCVCVLSSELCDLLLVSDTILVYFSYCCVGVKQHANHSCVCMLWGKVHVLEKIMTYLLLKAEIQLCRFVFSTYPKCRFVFSTYISCRFVFSPTQSVAECFQTTQSVVSYFSTYTKCRFIFSTYTKCRFIFFPTGPDKPRQAQASPDRPRQAQTGSDRPRQAQTESASRRNSKIATKSAFKLSRNSPKGAWSRKIATKSASRA